MLRTYHFTSFSYTDQLKDSYMKLNDLQIDVDHFSNMEMNKLGQISMLKAGLELSSMINIHDADVDTAQDLSSFNTDDKNIDILIVDEKFEDQLTKLNVIVIDPTYIAEYMTNATLSIATFTDDVKEASILAEHIFGGKKFAILYGSKLMNLAKEFVVKFLEENHLSQWVKDLNKLDLRFS